MRQDRAGIAKMTGRALAFLCLQLLACAFGQTAWQEVDQTQIGQHHIGETLQDWLIVNHATAVSNDE